MTQVLVIKEGTDEVLFDLQVEDLTKVTIFNREGAAFKHLDPVKDHLVKIAVDFSSYKLTPPEEVVVEEAPVETKKK